MFIGRRSAVAAPVMVFFYGGSWQSGSKGIYQFVGSRAGAARLCHGRAGLSALSRSALSRLHRGRRAGGALDERQCRAIRRRSGQAVRHGPFGRRLYRGDAGARRPLACGRSSLMPQRDIAGLIGVSGPYDFLPLRDPTLKTIFGGANVPATQPISHVSVPRPAGVAGDRSKGRHGRSRQFHPPGRASCGPPATTQGPSPIRGLGISRIIGAFAWPLRVSRPGVARHRRIHSNDCCPSHVPRPCHRARGGGAREP